MGVPFKAKNGLDANSNKIVNVSNPTAAQDAATKLYVDNAVGTGLPSQTGNSGKFLTTDATTASWSLVPVAGINATGTPSITTYLRGDGTWATVASGSGDVVGPASSTDNAIVRFDSTTGKLIQNSTATLSDGGIMIVTELDTDSIKSATANSPIVIAPDGTGDVHLNADSVRIGDNNANATIATNGTGDLIITTNEGSAVEGIVRLYDGVNGDITLTPNGSGQVKVGTDQVVTLVASQTLTNKTLSTSSTWNGNTIGVAYGGTGLTTLTAGYIPYGAGTSAFGSSANLFWDSANSRLGIGTTSPVTKLNILGSTAASGELGSFAISGSTTAKRVAFGVDSTGTMYGWIQSVESGVGFKNLNLQPLGGNVGIGTTSPSFRLDCVNNVAGLARFSLSNPNAGMTQTDLRIGAGSSTNDIFIGIVGTTSFIDNRSTSGVLVFQQSGTERMRLDTSGNLGIGTASPSNYAGFKTLTINGTTGAEIDFTTGGSLVGYIYNDSSNLFMGGNTGKSVAFLANASEGMRLTSTGLGIGTSSPASRLQLGTLSSVVTAAPETLSLGGTFSNTSGANIKLKVYDDGSLIGGMSVSGGQIEVNTWSTGKIAFYRGTTQSLIIDASSNVGIGTASPSYKLDVTGTLGVTGLSTFSGGIQANSNSMFFNGQTSALSVENQSTFTRFAFNKLTFYDWNAGRDIVILDNAVKFQPNHGSTKLQDDTGVVINGNYTNGAYSTRFRKWDDGNGLPLYVQETKGTPNVWTNVARFGQGESGQMYDFQVYGNTRVETNLDAGYFTILADSNNQFTQGALQLRSSSPTIYLRDTDHNSSMIHCNSSTFYILRGGNDTTTWATTNGYWPLTIDLTNNDATFGRNISAPVGSITLGGSVTGTEFYANGWFRNQNSGQGLYSVPNDQHFYSDGQYWNAAKSGTTGIRFRNGYAGGITGYVYAETSGYFGLLTNQGNWSLMSLPNGGGITLYGTEVNVNQTLYVHEAANRTRVPRTFVQTTAPGGTLTNGDIWIQF